MREAILSPSPTPSDDELTQAELERLIRLAREVKAGRAALVVIQPGVKGARLWIKEYQKAA